MIRRLAVVLLTALVSGCFSMGEFHTERLGEIQVGMTLEQVTERLGKPYMVNYNTLIGSGPEGQMIYGTMAVWAEGGLSGTRSVQMTFDEEGHLTKAPVPSSQ